MNHYQNYLELNETEKDEICALLVGEEMSKPVVGFACPILECKLNIPCELQECDFNVPNKKWIKNCILYYMNRENIQRITTTEASFLLDTPEEKIIEMYNKRMYKLRRDILKEELSTKNKITYLMDVNICCVCEAKTNSAIRIEGFTFCSTECLKKRPPFVFVLEKAFKSDIETIMETVMEKFKAIDVLESVLAISRKKIEFIISKYVPALSNKFISVLNSNPDFLNCRERRSVICEKALKKMSVQRKQFGIPENSLKGYFQIFYEQYQQKFA